MKPVIFTQPFFRNINSQRWLSFFITIFLFFSALALHAQDVLAGLTSNGGVQGKGTAYSIKTDGKSFTVLKGFADYGSYPVGDLVQAPDGNFYGMTPNGGTYNAGTIFKITSAGNMTILKHFNYDTDGGNPRGSLIIGKDGALYGTVSNGSTNSAGVIFKITTAGVYTVLRSLLSNTEGGHPYCRLVQALDGYLYGTTYNGGVNGYGTVFKMSTSGTSYTVLHAFKNGTTDGSYPYAGLIQGSDSAFYGMTYYGGTGGYGIVYRITGSGAFTILRSLNGATDGQYPYGQLLQAKDGYLYGMTNSGGANYSGTIFKVKTNGSSFTVIKALSTSTTGSNPAGSLIQATDGYLYGMTKYSPSGTSGEVFKISTSGTLTIIRKFVEATDGSSPSGSLVQGSDGLLYGMTYSGGKNLYGTVFKTTTGGTLTVLNHFNDDTYGLSPQNNLTLGKDSAYFGVTKDGGAYDAGTIFKICGGVTTVLHSFNHSPEGGNPLGSMVRARDGNLYGTTSYGGKNGAGTIYKITPTGTFTVIRHLTSATDGAYPGAALVEGADGFLYGTSPNGGSNGYGTLFKINTSGTMFTILRNLASTEGGMTGGLILAGDGFFYGVTNNGVFFKISSAGAYTSLHTFVYGSEGGSPNGTLVQGTDGAFYGSNAYGGTNYTGTIYKITTTGTVTVLRSLSAATDGSYPYGNLVQGTDGAFYGTTSKGGTYNSGTIFRITTSKSFTVLHHLNIATDGGTPLGGLILSPKITLLATTQKDTTNEDVAKAITLTGTGVTNPTFTITTQPRNGSVTSGTTASRTYTPQANFNGVDSFAFTINLGCLASTPAWVKIMVNAVNDAPVLASIGNKTVASGTKLTFTATATDADAGQTKTFSLIGAPSGATIGAATGAFSWTPATAGSYTFKVRVTDNGSPILYDEETITVTVTAALTTTVTTAAVNKVEETGPVVKASLFPNPVVSNFTVNLNQTLKEVKLTIVDMKGAAVYSKQYSGYVQQLQVSAAQLRPGAYVVLLQTTEATQTLKFIKQ